MSIDWLFDLERSIDNGKEVLACPGIGRNEWLVGKPIADLRKYAKRAADHKRMPVTIMRLISKDDVVTGDMFLIPTDIGEPGARGEPQVKWAIVDTKEAAENMRDVRHGPSPFFGMQQVETVESASSAPV